MKRNLLGLAAVVIAIGLSSFSAKFGTITYLVYNGGSNPQNDIDSYSPQPGEPAAQSGTTSLYWISVEDINGVSNIQDSEFDAAFAVLDSNHNSNLNDESEVTTSYTITGVGTGQTRLEKQ